MTEHAVRKYGELKYNIGRVAFERGATAASRQFNVTIDTARYYGRKYEDPTWHAGDWGGARNMHFDDEDRKNCDTVLLAELKHNPLRTLDQFAQVLTAGGFAVGRDYVKDRFSFYKITLKRVKRKHRAKFTVANKRYTIHYLFWVRSQDDWSRVKFADESSFESKSLVTKQDWAESHRELHVKIDPGTYSAKTMTFTCLTTLEADSGTFVSNPHLGTNRAENWLDFVTACINNGALRAGDTLVADNCRIHTAAHIIPGLRAALNAANVRFVLLPTYSPEYQPCELVFAKVKAALRSDGGRSGLAFGADIVSAFATVSRADVFGFYKKCIRDVL